VSSDVPKICAQPARVVSRTASSARVPETHVRRSSAASARFTVQIRRQVV
jgi:hypothetical protein